MSARKPKQLSIPLLEAFWKRYPFHDMSLESIVAVNRRVREFTLVITQVSKLTKDVEEFPTSWLYHSWTEHGDSFKLHVDLELGWCEVVGRELRLIRNDDLAILIPAIDA